MELHSRADTIAVARTSTTFQGTTLYSVSDADVYGWATSVTNLLQRAFGSDSSHSKAFEHHLSRFNGYETELRILQSIVAAARDDYEGGYLFNVRSFVKAEVLDDAFEQANELLRSGYKDPACVLAGVSLEVAVKDLAIRHNVPLGKLDRLNAELCKAGVYNTAKQKQITAWADLRNKAAHGAWNEYSAQDVEDMCRGVQRFVADFLQ
ncbi:MAG: DUF4145 domain-containing protein [Burkholderiaceae bacterium]